MLATSIGTALLGAALSGAAAPASGCIYAPLVPHRVDPALRQSDSSAPATPVVVSVEAFRRNGMTCTRASCVANSCGSTGTVRIHLAPSADDATPPEELGFRLVLVQGELPDSLRESVDVPLAAGQTLYLHPGFDELPLLRVALAAVAVDAAGNESPPTEPFEIHFDGCTLAAVGDRCEDELDPDTDLSDVLDGEDEPPAAEADRELAGGVSCSVGRQARSTPLAAAVLGLLTVLLAQRRRSPRAG
jgi:MYXO-CTERM domain-containing protein